MNWFSKRPFQSRPLPDPPIVGVLDKVAAKYRDDAEYWQDRAIRAEEQVNDLQSKLDKHTRGLRLGSAASAAKRKADAQGVPN